MSMVVDLATPPNPKAGLGRAPRKHRHGAPPEREVAPNVTYFICYKSEQPRPIQSGCACRDEAGLAHIECLVEVVVLQVACRWNAALYT